MVRAALEPEPEPERASRLLSADEAARAAALRSAEHRRRFVVAHGWLREVMGRYLGVRPELVRFERAEGGKPGLASSGIAIEERGAAPSGARGPSAEAPAIPPALRFNLSHSGEMALIALAREREVGVDVEQIKPRRDVLELARRALEPAAASELAALPVEARVDAFHRLWARHEARLKCLGTGLSRPAPAAALQAFDLDVAPGYAAAVAVEGEDQVALRLFSVGP